MEKNYLTRIFRYKRNLHVSTHINCNLLQMFTRYKVPLDVCTTFITIGMILSFVDSYLRIIFAILENSGTQQRTRVSNVARRIDFQTADEGLGLSKRCDFCICRTS